MACLAERALAEGEHLGWLHLEDQYRAVFVFEAAGSDLAGGVDSPCQKFGGCRPLADAEVYSA